MKNDNPMMEKYVETSWCPADVKELTGLSDEACMKLLWKVAPYLEDRLIELGWQVLEDLIGMYGDEEEDD
jgi:hypothetical protein